MNPEYRPIVKVPKAVAAKSKKSFFVRISLFEKINLSTDWLNVDIIQGGNRIGTENNKSFKKASTGKIKTFLYNVKTPKSLMTDYITSPLLNAGMWATG